MSLVLIVTAFIASLKVTVTLVPIAMPVDAFAGETPTTVGGVEVVKVQV